MLKRLLVALGKKLGFGYYIHGAGVTQFVGTFREALDWAGCGVVGETVYVYRWHGGNKELVAGLTRTQVTDPYSTLAEIDLKHSERLSQKRRAAREAVSNSGWHEVKK